MFCQVRNCRHKYSHVTFGHKCGKCGNYGHGQIECGNSILINRLLKYRNQVIPIHNRCNVINCNNNKLHKTIGHQCKKCNRYHSEENCIIQPFNILLNNFGHEPTLQNFDIDNFKIYHETSNFEKSYIKIFLGQGCSAFIRNINGDIMTIFMHCDSFGQYGYETSDLPILEKFIEGCIEIKPNKKINCIKCPLCRKENNLDSIFEIKGNDSKCCICLEKNVSIFLSKCGHACMCNTCFKNIKSI